jgi:hypothetical protein
MKPWVSVATLCREVVPFPVGGFSLLGIIEGLPIPPSPAAPPYVFHVNIACLLHFHSVEGLVSVIATIRNNERYFAEPVEQLLEVRPQDLGKWITGPVEIRVDEPGVYWLELTIDGEQAARTPIHIRPGT